MNSKEPSIVSGLTTLTTEDYHALTRERDELRAEVEYVKANYVTVAEEAQRRHDAMTPLVAEVARLNAEANRLAEQVYAVSNERDDLEAEIERLRAAVDALRGQMPHWVANTLKDARSS